MEEEGAKQRAGGGGGGVERKEKVQLRDSHNRQISIKAWFP